MDNLPFKPQDEYETEWLATLPYQNREWDIESVEVSVDLTESELDDIYDNQELGAYINCICSQIDKFFYESIDHVVEDGRFNISNRDDVRALFSGFSLGFNEDRDEKGQLGFELQVGIRFDNPDSSGFGFFVGYWGEEYVGMSYAG